MNKILQLYDEKFVTEIFRKKIIPLYPEFKDIKKINIKFHKSHVWEKTYHVVIEFKTIFITKDGKNKSLPIFCSAHSEEPRKNVYDALTYLWQHGFDRGFLTIPHPLFYSNNFRATFYRGVKGNNLYYYLKEKRLPEIEAIIEKSAAWFAKLHSIPAERAKNFNPENSRLSTVVPGFKHIIKKINHRYPQHESIFKTAYEKVIAQEEEFLATAGLGWLIHGDAHPENVIKMSEKKIAVIDFTDICLADFARDLGTFLQQLDYMGTRKIQDPKYISKIKKLFLTSYLDKTKIKLDSDLRKRIENYYYWTALRTAGFFLLKDPPEIERADQLINEINKNKINIS